MSGISQCLLVLVENKLRMHLLAQEKQMSITASIKCQYEMDAGTHLDRKKRIVFYIKASPPYRNHHVIIAAFMCQQANLNLSSIYAVSTVSPALKVWLLSTVVWVVAMDPE